MIKIHLIPPRKQFGATCKINHKRSTDGVRIFAHDGDVTLLIAENDRQRLMNLSARLEAIPGDDYENYANALWELEAEAARTAKSYFLAQQ